MYSAGNKYRSTELVLNVLGQPMLDPEADSTFVMLSDCRRFLSKWPERVQDIVDIIKSRDEDGWKNDGAGPVTNLSYALNKVDWALAVHGNELYIERSRMPLRSWLAPMSLSGTDLDVLRDQFIDAWRKAMWRRVRAKRTLA